MIRRPPRSTQGVSSAASDVYKRQMLSTPILNLPQSGVLGMHNIVERPVVVDGDIKIRPIMYLALSYDHRIIDGKESVSFLKMIKENLEDPRRLFLDI